MKAMIWKELRENFRWAALGCLVLTLAEFYIISAQRHNFGNNGGNLTITDSTFLMVVLFGSALVAAGLGALQILPESNRDRWAALLHRPVPRSVILGGKAVAGLGLYAVAVTLPFLACAGYAAWPGRFPAPFVPALLLPGLHALAGGAAFYAGALLLCLHRGRWFGTRGIVLIAVGSVFVLQLASDGPFLVLPLVTTSTLLLAAWGTMLNNGAAAHGPWPGRVAFLAVILLGAQGGLLLGNAALGLLPNSSAVLDSNYTRLEVTVDGQVFKVVSNLKGGDTVVTDLKGHAITDERYIGNNSYEQFCQFWPLSYQLNAPRHGYFYTNGEALRGINYVQPILLGSYAKENWYLLVRQNYFIGYDNLSCRCVGICDREGFKAPGAKPVPFDLPLAGEHLLQAGPSWFWTGAKLRLIAFLDRQVTPFFEQPGASIVAAVQVPERGSYESYRYVMVALKDEFRVLDAQGKVLFAHPYLHDPRVWNAVQVASGPGGGRLYVQSQNGFYSSDMEHRPDNEYLDELDLQGNVLHSYSVPTEVAAVEPLWRRAAGIAPVPFVPGLMGHVYRRVAHAPPPQELIWLDQQIETIKPVGWVFLGAFALALATVAFVWARRVGFATRRAWGWAAFVFVFGPAGLITFRLASQWPKRVHCPSCGHLRSLSGDRCAHCQKAWSTPPPTGTEIFQPLAT